MVWVPPSRGTIPISRPAMDNHVARLASTRSSANGSFDFGEQTLPTDQTFFQVAPRGVSPDPEGMLRVERRVRAPAIFPEEPGGWAIFLVAAERGGEFRIYDAETGILLLRREVEAHGDRSPLLDIRAELNPPWPYALRIEQVLDDGRRSERGFWRLDP